MKENKSDFIKKMMELQKLHKEDEPIQLLEIENKPINTEFYLKIANCTNN